MLGMLELLRRPQLGKQRGCVNMGELVSVTHPEVVRRTVRDTAFDRCQVECRRFTMRVRGIRSFGSCVHFAHISRSWGLNTSRQSIHRPPVRLRVNVHRVHAP